VVGLRIGVLDRDDMVFARKSFGPVVLLRMVEREAEEKRDLENAGLGVGEGSVEDGAVLVGLLMLRVLFALLELLLLLELWEDALESLLE
jgi:hypothetical protein